ncbi:MAG TPA: metalloregulator ArsR/SmtB family transcription factor [Syntrophales bacterium]|nr:metalloregulator ArsR/SmtB family transcription factor [Syntrophales bacterium]HPQ42828.1 metalloregulator ArsR/SmtB family transcription factor [Syntrophales bacterium]
MDTVDYEKMSEFFKTLGNPTRLRIIKELAEGEKCVGTVEDCVHASQANISQNLTILKGQGIVDCRKEKNMRCYYLKKPELFKSLLSLMETE